MNNKNFQTYIDFGSSQIRAISFDKNNHELNHQIEVDCKSNFDPKNIDLKAASSVIEKVVLEIEKKNKEYLNDIYLMLDCPCTLPISLSVYMNNDKKKLAKEQLKYLIQDAKQKIQASYPDQEIIHIVVTNYQIDKNNYQNIPKDIIFENISIDLLFICFPKSFVKKINDLFNSYNIKINRILCSSYSKCTVYNEQFKLEKKLVFIDIGHDKTSIFFYLNGRFTYFKILLIGGNHITKDISKILKIDINTAEEIKLSFDRQNYPLNKKNFSLELIKKIIFSRTEEILEMSTSFLEKFVSLDNIKLIFTGNGSKILDNNFKENISFSSNIDLLDEDSLDICKSGLKIIQGISEQEVVLVPKIDKKKGIFERFFNLFQ